MASPWPRDAFVRAVWSSTLRPMPRLVALAYGDHARKGDTAWLTLDRVADVTGMSRDSAHRNLRILIAAGWLELVEQGRQHRASRYRLVIPSSPGDVPLAESQQSGSRTTAKEFSSTAPDASSTAPDVSSPGAVLDLQETNQETAHGAAVSFDLDELLARIGRDAK